MRKTALTGAQQAASNPMQMHFHRTVENYSA
jgi:hypothetical protein